MKRREALARDVLSAARTAAEPSPADRSRVRSQLSSSLGVALGGASFVASGTAHAATNAAIAGQASGAGAAATGAAAGQAAGAGLLGTGLHVTLAKIVVAGALITSGGFGAGFVAGQKVEVEAEQARATVNESMAPSERSSEQATRPSAGPKASEQQPDQPKTAQSEGSQARPTKAAEPLVDRATPSGAAPRSAAATEQAAASGNQSSEQGVSEVKSGEKKSGAAESAAPLDPELLGSELALLRRAQRMLHLGNAPMALGILSEMRARYPGGPLAEEGAVLEVLALCGAGRVAEAHTAADRFAKRFPGSMHAGRVARSCAGGPSDQ